jgi:hypothetical protein
MLQGKGKGKGKATGRRAGGQEGSFIETRTQYH